MPEPSPAPVSSPSDWATGRGWRVDVTLEPGESLFSEGEQLPPPSSGASAARLDRPGRRLGLQFGPWAVVVSGESLTAAEVDTLLADVSFAPTAEGFLMYRGRLPLWLVDAPSAYVIGKELRVSAFMGGCGAGVYPVRPTGTGLVSWHFEDPAPGRKVSGLCDLARKLEIWLDTPGMLSDDELDRVDIEVLSVGSALDALQRGWHP
jgi:hypothetical protein